MEAQSSSPSPPIVDNNRDMSILTPKVRAFMVKKIASVLVPFPDVNAPYDNRMIELNEYIKYMERKAFERVQTRDDYYTQLAKIILRIYNQRMARPKGPDNDPYSNIPLSHEMADFMGLTEEELEEFDREYNPQDPDSDDEEDSKTHLTRQMRLRVIDKLQSLLFPAPDPFAHYDGRMDNITNKLKQIEAEAFSLSEDRDEYYNIASLKAYRLQKSLKRKGEPYVEQMVKHPAVVTGCEIVEAGCSSLSEDN
uniref:Histone acetyltransferase n=1 Tax=Caenorhabditis tropicalis TaxID=1561998 RepID=A0A1I7TNE2_9PELO